MSCAALGAAALGSAGQESGYILGRNIWRLLGTWFRFSEENASNVSKSTQIDQGTSNETFKK